MLKKAVPILGIGIMTVCVAGIAYAIESRHEPAPDDLPAWQTYFSVHTTKHAYTGFVRAALTLSYDDAHALAHQIGQILYAKEGIHGIAYCTDDFAYGCYHGFTAGVLQDQGLDAIAQLRDACTASSAYFACIHGIGHGILSYEGRGRLVDALRACAPLQGDALVGGCFGGVFMEYNFSTMQGPAGMARRAFSRTEAQKPCTELPHEYQAACYYEAPAWWRASLEAGEVSLEGVFSRIGLLCTDTPLDMHEACFRGAGNIVRPRAAEDPAERDRLCGTLPTERARALCMDEAGH